MENVCEIKQKIVDNKTYPKINMENKDSSVQPSPPTRQVIRKKCLHYPDSNEYSSAEFPQAVPQMDQISDGKKENNAKPSNGCENKKLCDKLKATHIDFTEDDQTPLKKTEEQKAPKNDVKLNDHNHIAEHSNKRLSTDRDKNQEQAASFSGDSNNLSKRIVSTNPFQNLSHRQTSFVKSQSLDLYNGVIEPNVAFPVPKNYCDNSKPEKLLQGSIEEDEQSIEMLSKVKENESENHSPETMASDEAEDTQSKLSSKPQSIDSRPIYPNIPYSPYNSPHSNRRRLPLRESRRVSIERSGSFLQLNQYKLMDQIGQGSYGLVKLAYSEEDSTHYAMKILSKRRLLKQAGLLRRGPKKSISPLDRVYREIAVLKKLDHPNVVRLIEVLDDPMEDFLYMVFELVKQGEVLTIPTKAPLTEARAWSVFRDTILGLEYLHFQKIIHGDLKPANLLLTECGRVKIADLGVCNEFFGEDATISNSSTPGTPAFRAPETLNPGQIIYCGRAADIWALGITLFALVFGDVPYKSQTVPILYECIKNEPVRFPETPQISEDLRDCINCMLIKDPVKRVTLPELKEHPWVTAKGMYPLPTEDENCCLVQVNDEDINSVVRSIPKLDTLILIKTMLKKHSFGNPFNRSVSGRAPQHGGSRLERFIRAGRSNSAPGSYNMALARQLSSDSILPSLLEHNSNINSEESESRESNN